MKYITIMRPSHWTKNVFIFAALIFGQKLCEPLAFGRAIGAFIFFSLAASAVYIINDIIDRRADKLHPEKSKRPIASGDVKIGPAMILSAICALTAFLGSLLLARDFAVIVLVYIILMIFYSLLFKNILILDCIVISIGFCLRAVAGAIVLQKVYPEVFISPWLVICTFALCLFLAFGKRRSEIAQLNQDREDFRITLSGYTPELLAHMLDVTSGLAVVCFLLYAMDERTFSLFGTYNLVYTTPVVLYCIFRFSALIQKGGISDPVHFILTDRPFQIGLLTWIVLCVMIIYTNRPDGFGGV